MESDSSKAASKAARPTGKVGPNDWVRLGIAVLARDGIDAVRVEPLAAQLGVTKGSFYWHFKDRAALHGAMLEYWRDFATREIIDRVEGGRQSSLKRLRYLISIAASDTRAASLETAIRSWARLDPAVAGVVTKVDAERIDYVAALLAESGVAAHVVHVRARILYLALIGGYFAAASNGLEGDPDFWPELIRLVT